MKHNYKRVICLNLRLLYCILVVISASICRAQLPLQNGFLQLNRSIAGEKKNLLENGDLEKWNSKFILGYEFLEDWSLPSNDYVMRENTIVFEGKCSAKMQSKKTGVTARIEQKIAVSPGQKIRILFRYYVEQWKSKGARTYCYFRTDAAEKYNISADELKSFYGNEQYYIIRGGGFGKTYFSHDQSVWQTFDETVEVPPTAHYFVFGVNSYNGTTIYVDDCWVTDATVTTIKGDVNGDTVIDVADIASVISVMSGSADNNSTTSADVNDDGTVDVADIAAIISKMASASTNAED